MTPVGGDVRAGLPAHVRLQATITALSRAETPPPYHPLFTPLAFRTISVGSIAPQQEPPCPDIPHDRPPFPPC